MPLNLVNQVASVQPFAAINLNLRLTVYHLIENTARTHSTEKSFRTNGLLQIIQNLEMQSPLPGPGIKENLDEWMNGIQKIPRRPICSNGILMDSRLLIEMFLGVMRIISRKFPSAPTAVEFMGFNDEFTVYNLLGKPIFHHRGHSFLQELVSAHQF